MESGKKFTYKTTFYCIRGLLSADIATQQRIPELLINDLFKQFDIDNDVLKIAKDSLERKKQQTEKEVILASDQQKILTIIQAFIKQLESKMPLSSNNQQRLETVLTDYSVHLKTHYYA
jgi:predicted nucleotidyltransferase